MASSTTSYSTKSKLSHNISVIEDQELPAIHYERTVSKGQPVHGHYKIDSYHTEPLKVQGIPVQKVSTYQEYIAGCTLHDNCLGHFCITPRGTILLPQKLASTLGVMSNDFAKMAENVFGRDTSSQEEEYRSKLKSLMQGKSGKMRGDMPAGPVDGSMRMVLSLCWEMAPGYIAIPKVVAMNMRILRIPRDNITGLPLGYYVEDRIRELEVKHNYILQNGQLFVEEEVLHEGDFHIGVRPPSLWAGNVQPLKVILWNHECLGISPSNADEYHADHDGDEFQTYHIATEEALDQCKSWKQLNECKFNKAVRSIELPFNCYKVSKDKRKKFFEYLGLREKFMVHSTLSIKELQDGIPLTQLSKAARIKEPMVNMMVERLRNPESVFGKYYSESQRGIKDVIAQRCRQGELGDMTRQAKLAASCVRYKEQGVFEIKTSSGSVTINDPQLEDVICDIKYPLGGNPCMRAVSAICQVAQQAALDSHRVSQEVSSSLDLVNNLIVGGDESLVVFEGNVSLECSWKYVQDEKTYVIALNDSIKALATRVVAAYSPEVLNEVKIMNGNMKQVCRNGIVLVCNYYKIELSKLELHALAELLCFRCELSPIPITTKKGIRGRDLRWMVTIFADHFGVLSKLQSRGLTRRSIKPETITEATAFCNFDNI